MRTTWCPVVEPNLFISFSFFQMPLPKIIRIFCCALSYPGSSKFNKQIDNRQAIRKYTVQLPNKPKTLTSSNSLIIWRWVFNEQNTNTRTYDYDGMKHSITWRKLDLNIILWTFLQADFRVEFASVFCFCFRGEYMAVHVELGRVTRDLNDCN